MVEEVRSWACATSLSEPHYPPPSKPAKPSRTSEIQLPAFCHSDGCNTTDNVSSLRSSDEGERHLDDVELADDGRPYTVAGYLNGMGSVIAANGTNRLEIGPDGQLSRPELSAEQTKAPNYEQQALVPKLSETHSATDVAAYAQGPSSQLIFGTMEQSWIFHVMLHAFEAPPAPPALVVTPPFLDAEHDRDSSDEGLRVVTAGVLCGIVGAAIGGHIGRRIGAGKGTAHKARTTEEENLVYRYS